MNNKSVFGERLAYLRTKHSLMAKDLAIKIDISKSSVSLYESGKGFPTVEKLISLANFFNVSTDYLLGRTNEPQI